MKKSLALFFSGLFLVSCMANGWAVTVKKAAPVSTKQASSSSTTASLVPTVLGLVSNVQALTAKQKALTDDCIPTSQEIDFVNKTIKEWAKTGKMSADEVQRTLRRKRCDSANNGFMAAAERAAGTESGELCYEYFSGTGNEGMIWENYPKANKVSVCKDGSGTCAEKDKQVVSDVYEIFNLVDFDTQDYTPSEIKMVGNLTGKIEQCSNAKLSAKKREMWDEFLTNTISGVGQKTNTGSIMEQVSGIAGSGGFNMGSLGSLGSVAAQFMNK